MFRTYGCIKKARSLLPAVVALALATAALCACGYRMIGDGAFPGGAKTIAVSILENRTAETGLEQIVTNALVVELSRRHKGTLAPAGRADAVLSGKITTLSRETIARSGSKTAEERRVTLTVTLNLTRADGAKLWNGRTIQAEQAYVVVGNEKMGTEMNRRRAIGQAAQRLAETVMRQMTDAF